MLPAFRMGRPYLLPSFGSLEYLWCQCCRVLRLNNLWTPVFPTSCCLVEVVSVWGWLFGQQCLLKLLVSHVGVGGDRCCMHCCMVLSPQSVLSGKGVKLPFKEGCISLLYLVFPMPFLYHVCVEWGVFPSLAQWSIIFLYKTGPAGRGTDKIWGMQILYGS